MAARLFLTLLALLASLAAQLTPAQARVRAGGASEIEQSIALIQGERRAASPVRVRIEALRSDWRRSSATPISQPQVGFSPAVLLRIDRARE